MKKQICLLLCLSLLCLCGCRTETPPTTTAPPVIPTETTVPVTTAPIPTETTLPPHSALYLDGISPEDVLLYFEEVVLQMEYTDGTGDPTRVQKWLAPIRYSIDGDPTEEDLAVLNALFDQLNQIEGFPGIRPAEEDEFSDLTLSFLDPDTFRDSFSDAVQGEDAYGAAQFWYYTETCELYTARIGYRTDLDQTTRSSILLEEVINILGVSDSLLRSDSIVYQYSNENLALSDVDWLILKLLYHPSIECGMNAAACTAVIMDLYY